MLQTNKKVENAQVSLNQNMLDQLSADSLSDLVSCMEIVAYSLMRSDDRAAANTLFYAVSELEKIQSRKAKLSLVS